MAQEITTTIEIAATPEQVWTVLADLPSYPQWHPVFRAVSGQLTAGSKLTITSTIPTTGHTMTVKVKVLTAEPGTELRWESKLLGVTISERRFLLSPVEGGTALVQAETYRGLRGMGALGGPGSARSTVSVIGRIQGTFEAINQAIKEQAEERSR
jgi:hypothetical protein